ncbi:hypothetical protein UlMin_029870 [Ulmus minor]
MAIRVVWNYNFLQEFQAFDRCLQCFHVLSFDTKFLGFLLATPRFEKENIVYDDFRINVDSFKVIQLGITLSDESRNIGGTWEFNFSDFNEKNDFHHPNSIAFLKKNGLDFDEIKEKGIPSAKFAKKFRWVSFHANYDLGYLLKLVRRMSMPSSVVEFARINGEIFGAIYDVKYMARYYSELYYSEIGLAKMAKIFGIKRRGEAHHAGSDSLLTAEIYSKMATFIGLEINSFEGYLYGISHRFIRCSTTVIFVMRP